MTTEAFTEIKVGKEHNGMDFCYLLDVMELNDIRFSEMTINGTPVYLGSTRVHKDDVIVLTHATECF